MDKQLKIDLFPNGITSRDDYSLAMFAICDFLADMGKINPIDNEFTFCQSPMGSDTDDSVYQILVDYYSDKVNEIYQFAKVLSRLLKMLDKIHND